MAYTTYQFYKDVYGGAMDEADFCRYAARAGYVLEAMTQDRVKSLYPAPAPAVAEPTPTAPTSPDGSCSPGAGADKTSSKFSICGGGAAHSISMAMGAVLDGLAREEQTGGRTVVLEAVGKHRIGYAATVQSAARSLRRDAAPYLRGVCDADGVPLLRRCACAARGRGA